MKKVLLTLTIIQGLSVPLIGLAMLPDEQIQRYGELFGRGFYQSFNPNQPFNNPNTITGNNPNTTTGFTNSFSGEIEERTKVANDAMNSVMKNVEQNIKGPISRSIEALIWPLLKVVTCLAAISSTSYLVQKAGEKYIKNVFFEPSLIERKSTSGWLKTITSWFKRKSSIDNLKNHMIIDEKLEKSLKSIMTMAANTKNNGGQFENILLYGSPGTGKTLFAQLLAEYCGMDYAIIPGANVSQFLAKGEAVEKINELFEWATTSKKGTIIFLDEAETFLADRKDLSNEAQNALNAFLAKTGTPSTNVLIIAATNRPEILDRAVLSRFGSTIEFPLPDLQARIAQLNMHIKAIFGNQRNKKVDYALLQKSPYICELAQRLDGCSGRTIQQLVNRILQYALAQNLSTISASLVNEAILRIEEKRKLEDKKNNPISTTTTILNATKA
jgi:ATPase family AAA domain-containing protein 3A/B